MNSIVVHYQEIALKGKNRPWFLSRLVRNLRGAVADLDVRAVRPLMGRIEVELGPGVTREEVGERIRRTFGVATGQPSYPTPVGNFEIVTMQRNPWWYPPQSDWAEGAEPIPPGPGNPLGTRWMGLSAPLVGIHGTPDPASIGYSASHGCIRMQNDEVTALYPLVPVGTHVLVVGYRPATAGYWDTPPGKES